MSPKSGATAWMNGEYIPWGEARLHVRTDAVMRGGSVFEGIPGYWSDQRDQLFIFRLEDHLARLARSMKVLRMDLDQSLDTVREACLEVVRRSAFREDVHVRPTVYFGEGASFGYLPGEIEVGSFVTATPLPRHPHGAARGLTAAISSWQRISDRDMPPRVKAAANYQNSRLAQTQAASDGYDTAILLNAAGHVTETPAACLLLVKDGVVVTPRTTNGILESITRASLIQLIRNELDLEVVERDVDRTELYVADELFECGSAHEVTPIVSVDRFDVGKGTVGDLTRQVMDLYSEVTRGQRDEYANWLTPVY